MVVSLEDFTRGDQWLIVVSFSIPLSDSSIKVNNELLAPNHTFTSSIGTLPLT